MLDIKNSPLVASNWKCPYGNPNKLELFYLITSHQICISKETALRYLFQGPWLNKKLAYDCTNFNIASHCLIDIFLNKLLCFVGPQWKISTHNPVNKLPTKGNVKLVLTRARFRELKYLSLMKMLLKEAFLHR